MILKQKYKKIIAWGAGDLFLSTCLDSLEISYIVDIDEKKQGMVLNGYECTSLSRLLREDPATTCVIITAYNWEDILRYARQNGVLCDFFPIISFVPNPISKESTNAYALYCEDAIIANIADRSGFEIKHYIDIGANTPVYGNATFLFYEKGAKGIVVEPNSAFKPDYECVRPRDLFLNVAVASEEENGVTKTFYDFPEINTLNCLSRENAVNLKGEGYSCIETKVECRSLNEICREADFAPDYISVDIEGWEYQVLKDFDFKMFNVSVFNIEKGDNRLADLFEDNGYLIVAETISNYVFLKRELFDKKALGAGGVEACL